MGIFKIVVQNKFPCLAKFFSYRDTPGPVFLVSVESLFKCIHHIPIFHMCACSMNDFVTKNYGREGDSAKMEASMTLFFANVAEKQTPLFANVKQMYNHSCLLEANCVHLSAMHVLGCLFFFFFICA